MLTKISTQVVGLSSAIPTQFIVEMCVAAQNRKKITKALHFLWGEFKIVQDHGCLYP